MAFVCCVRRFGRRRPLIVGNIALGLGPGGSLSSQVSLLVCSGCLITRDVVRIPSPSNPPILGSYQAHYVSFCVLDMTYKCFRSTSSKTGQTVLSRTWIFNFSCIGRLSCAHGLCGQVGVTIFSNYLLRGREGGCLLVAGGTAGAISNSPAFISPIAIDSNKNARDVNLNDSPKPREHILLRGLAAAVFPPATRLS